MCINLIQRLTLASLSQQVKTTRQNAQRDPPLAQPSQALGLIRTITKTGNQKRLANCTRLQSKPLISGLSLDKARDQDIDLHISYYYLHLIFFTRFKLANEVQNATLDL